MGYDMYRITNPDDEPEDPHATPGGYFRLNIWGMAEVRPELEKYGITKECPRPSFKWEGWQRANTSEGPGICVHKLCSNDGWIVTPIEIVSGVGFADKTYRLWRKDISEHALAFVTWMEGSSLGFEVW